MAYKKDTDYQAIINDAVARGDYQTAAAAEASRNEKIAAMNASGTNPNGYTATNRFSGWLDNTDYGAIGKQQMALGASAQDVLDTYNSRYNKAANTEGLTKYANDEIQQEMWDYITANIKKQDTQLPTYDFAYSGDSRPTYDSSYSQRIDDMLNQILNRDAFSYDAANDPLYQQYKTQYNREGNRSMNDTLASAAANAGGMNSYAITAAQQANDYYATQLNDKIPELYQLAYEMYLQDIDNQVRDLGLLTQMDDTQYARYRDTMGDWENDRDFAYNKYRDDMSDYQWGTEFNYGIDRDNVSDDRYDQEWEYQQQQDAYSKAMTMLKAGAMPDASTLKVAGISSTEAVAYLAANKPVASSSGGSSSGSSGGYRGGSSSGSSSGGSSGSSSSSGYTGSGDSDELRVDMQSVMDLGYGPISEEKLDQLVRSGMVEQYQEGNVIKFRKKTTSSPPLSSSIPDYFNPFGF